VLSLELREPVANFWSPDFSAIFSRSRLSWRLDQGPRIAVLLRIRGSCLGGHASLSCVRICGLVRVDRCERHENCALSFIVVTLELSCVTKLEGLCTCSHGVGSLGDAVNTFLPVLFLFRFFSSRFHGVQVLGCPTLQERPSVRAYATMVFHALRSSPSSADQHQSGTWSLC